MDESDGLPSWVVRDGFAVRDLTFLALNAMAEGRAEEMAAGLVAAAGWVQGVLPAPVTGEPSATGSDPDVWDVRAVEAESWAAGLAGDPHGGLDMDEVCRVLNVPSRIPRRSGPNFAAGVFTGLRWMLGMDDVAPMPLPWRTLDGQPARAPYIYARLLAEAAPLDEVGQARLRAEATRLAVESRRLAVVVAQQLERSQAQD